MTPPPVETSAPFDLKGSILTLAVLYLHSTDDEAIDHHLAYKARQAPEFFKNAPVIVDLAAFDKAPNAIDFAQLGKLLRQRGLIPVGVRHGHEAVRHAAELAGLAVLPDARGHQASSRELKPSDGGDTPTRLIKQPVRSGQQIYASDGDLIILSTISAGAEVLADGHIHVYGTLRGRALAGARGNTEARIFCQSLKAELISIAGTYRIIEQPDLDAWGKPVQIYLTNEQLIIEPLSSRNGSGR